MAFASLNTKTKQQTEDVAKRWQHLLASGGIHIKAYAIEETRIIFVSEGGFQDIFKVKDFVLDQEEAIDFEWNQKKFYPTKPKKKSGKKSKVDL